MDEYTFMIMSGFIAIALFFTVWLVATLREEAKGDDPDKV